MKQFIKRLKIACSVVGVILVFVIGFGVMAFGLEKFQQVVETRLCERQLLCKYANIDNDPAYDKAIEIANHPNNYTNAEVIAAVQKLDNRYKHPVIEGK